MQHDGLRIAGRQEHRRSRGVASTAGAVAAHAARPRGSTLASPSSVGNAAPSSTATTTMARIGRAALRMAVYLTTRMERAS